MIMPEPTFPSECRKFALRLDESLAGGVPEHASQCAPCRRLWYAARRNARLLRACGRSEALGDSDPRVISTELDAIYRRVADEVAGGPTGKLLGAALTPLEAPGDVVWREPVAAPAVARSLRRLPSRRAPGWIWSRVRAEIHPLPATPRWSAVSRSAVRRGALGLAAAVVLSAVILFRPSGFGSGNTGTSAPSPIVWLESSQPFDAAQSFQALTAVGRGS